MEERKQTDILDYWVEGKKEPQPIYEGDIVLLHNWGCDDGDQVIGVAIVVWDTEYHKWDFKMLGGDYIDDEYDRWRQSPRVIGNTKDGVTDEEFKKYVSYPEDKDGWDKLIEEHRINAEIKFNKRLLARIKHEQEKKIIAKRKEIEECEQEIAKLTKQMKAKTTEQ